MTRELFIATWVGERLMPFYSSDTFSEHVDRLLSATRKAALDEAMKIAELHDCCHKLCDCESEIVEAIAKAKNSVAPCEKPEE